MNIELVKNEKTELSGTAQIPADAKYSQPYWLEKEDSLGLFNVDNQEEIGMPENKPVTTAKFDLEIGGYPFHYAVPVAYQKTDPILGEIYQPLATTPPVYVSLDQKVYLFDGDYCKKVKVNVKSASENLVGAVQLKLPDRWRLEPISIPISLKAKGVEQNVIFDLFPPDHHADEAEISEVVTIDGRTYDRSRNLISYPHIPTQISFPKATAKAVKVDIHKNGQLIGYAVIVGLRAYNMIERLKIINPILLKYVEHGGHLIVQYNSDQGQKKYYRKILSPP